MLAGKIKYIFSFVLLLLLQVLIFNHIYISGYANPQIYVFFILMLPVTTPGYILLLVAFALGFTVDVFTDSMAIHTAATLFMAFCRPGILRLLIGPTREEEIVVPSYPNLGIFAVFIYALLLVFIHHTTLFFLEVFRFTNYLETLSRSLVSTGITLAFVLIAFAFVDSAASDKHKPL